MIIMAKKRICLFVLSVMFIISGFVFTILLGSNYISEIIPFHSGFSSLEYINLFFSLMVSSYAVGIVLLCAYIILKLKRLGSKFFVIILALTIIPFIVVNVYVGVSDISSYSEEGMSNFGNVSDGLNEAYSEYFPCYYDMVDDDLALPYYFLYEYKIKNSVYRISQITTDGVVEDGKYKDKAISVEYFETDKPYLLSKYKSEKYFIESLDDDGNDLDTSNIKEIQYEGYTCSVTILDTSQRFVIQGDNYYFNLYVDDADKDLNIDEQKLIELGIQQYNLMKNSI
jgi:hypothetical protein